MSDQDFFFDEDEATPATKGAPKTAPKAAAKGASAAKPAAAPVEPSSGGSFFDQSLTMTVAALLMVIALLVGVIIGFFLGGAMTPSAAASANEVVPSTSAPAGTGSGTPGQLSQDQINQGLPAGHVPVDPAATATTTPAP